MKIKNRWLSALLALSMLLSLASLSVFAETEEVPEGGGEDVETVPAPYVEYEERFDGKQLSDVAVVDRNTPSSARLGTAEVGNDAHVSVLQMDFTAEAPERYYLWKGIKEFWPFTSCTENPDGTLSGMANAKEITNAPINRNKNTQPVTLSDGQTYYVVTGEFVEAYAGYQGNISQPLILQNPAFEAREGYFTIALDLYLSVDFATVKGVTGRISVLDANGKNARLELFSLNSSYSYAEFAKHNNSTYREGGPLEIKMGEWHRLTFIVDRATTRVTALLDGVFAFVVDNGTALALLETAAIPLAFAPSSFQLEINRMNYPNDIDGFFQVDNILMHHGTPEEVYEKGSIGCDFEDHSLGLAPTQGVAYCELSDSTVENNHGSHAWNVPLNTANVGKMPRFSYPKTAYTDVASLVFGADYFIEATAKGTLLGRIHKLTAFVDDAESASRLNSGVDLYAVTVTEDGSVTLTAGAQSHALTRDRWVRIDSVLSLVDGTFDLYVDGVLIFDDVQLCDGESVLTNLTVLADALVLCGVGDGTEGNVQIDNVQIYRGDALRQKPETLPLLENFEAYAERIGFSVRDAKMPALATYGSRYGNTAIRLGLGTLRGDDGYALLHEGGTSVFAYDVIWEPEVDDTVVTVPETYFLSEEEFDVEFDEELGLYYILCDEGYYGAPDIHVYYIVPNNVAESAFAAANVGSGVSLPHGEYSFANTERVLLEADYFFSSDSYGTVASTLEGFRYGNTETYGASSIVFWSMDAATGSIADSALSFRLDAWNNVKVILNLGTGTFDLYINDRFAYSRESGRTEITFGFDQTSLWNIAASVPHASPVGTCGGEAWIDNVRVDAAVPEGHSQYDDRFLSDAGYFRYLSEALMMQAEASIRLEAPNGLRFATKIDEALFSEIESKFTVTGMGTLISPLDYVETVGGLDPTLLAEKYGSAGYLDVPYLEDFEGAAGLSLEGRSFTASIVKLKAENVSRDFAACSYVRIAIDAETELVLYSEIAVANARDTALGALERADAEWSDAERSILTMLAGLTE